MNKILIGILVAVVVVAGAFYFLQPRDEVQSEENLAREKEGYVYETEVSGPEECSAYEKYDAENNMCYFECDNEAQCKEIEDAIDKEFSSWSEELKNDKEPVAEKVISEDDPSLEAEYKVSSGEKITLAKGKDSELNQDIWKQIAELSPDSLSNTYIEEYQVFDSPSDDTLAFVDDQDGNGKWRVAVNLAGYKSSTARENKATFIHELFHIISLNSSQVVPGEGECENFKIEEGCANVNSYLNIFKNTFWKGVDKQEYVEGKFITEYAATNEVEDLAESFSFFVLSKEKEELGNSESEQKLKFMYNFPELVSLRSNMRNIIGKEIVRARMAN